MNPSARWLIALVFFAWPAGAAVDAGFVDRLVEQAHSRHLAGDPQWLRLGHWQPKRSGGFHSQAMGDFFLAPDGNENPRSELDATLRGIFGLIPLTPEQSERKAIPAACRFPARAWWLLKELKFDAANLPQEECPRLTDYFRKLDAASVSLVFSSYYLNSPSSAFGHTFLRIHRRFEGVSAEKRELLDYAIDYSAKPDTTNPVLYAIKGVTGLFRGDFHLLPYYYKVREYNDYEARDLWEYDLALNPYQVFLLVAHLFELGSSWFRYYYVDENCSYQVLTALEAAAPELHLVDHVKTVVVPSDTVKALYANPGLVSAVHYRPSAVTQFEARLGGLSSRERAAVRELAVDPEAALPAGRPEEQMRIFDAAADLIDIRYARDLPFAPEGKGGQLKRRVLERRAALLRPSPELDLPVPWSRQPQLAHGSARAAVHGGFSDLAGPLVALEWRLALHDLGDAARGYPELAQIEFLPTELRFYPRSQSLQLERFDLVKVLSMHPLSLFDPALSWKMNAGAHRIRDGGCAGCLAFAGGFGSGFTLATAGEWLAVFLFGDVTLEAAPGLRGIWQAQAVRVGVGPFGGARLRLGERGVFLVEAGWRWLPGAIVHQTWFAETSLRFEVAHWLAFGVSGRKDVDAAEGLGQVFLYY